MNLSTLKKGDTVKIYVAASQTTLDKYRIKNITPYKTYLATIPYTSHCSNLVGIDVCLDHANKRASYSLLGYKQSAHLMYKLSWIVIHDSHKKAEEV